MAVVAAAIVNVCWPHSEGIVVLRQCQSLLYSFCQTICEGKNKNKRELIERRSKGHDWHAICFTFASWDKTTMVLFAPIATTNYSFGIIVSIIDK